MADHLEIVKEIVGGYFIGVVACIAIILYRNRNNIALWSYPKYMVMSGIAINGLFWPFHVALWIWDGITNDNLGARLFAKGVKR